MVNLNWTSDHTTLQDTLAAMYWDLTSAKRLVDQVSMDPKHIHFSPSAADNWHQIILEADAQGKLIELIEQAIDEHGKNETLEDLLKAFKGQLGKFVDPGKEVLHQVGAEIIKLARIQREGGYQIDAPPADWIAEEITPDLLISKSLGINLHKNANSNQLEVSQNKGNILLVRSQSQLKIEYNPGESKMNGRETLLIVPEIIYVALLKIVPVERYRTPPAFVRQSLEHTFVEFLASLLKLSNLRSLSPSTTKDSNRFRLTAELDQRIENVTANGIPGQSLTVNVTVIGIQGVVRDYILTLSYVSQATSDKEEIESQVALMQKLVNSFKLIEPENFEKEDLLLQEDGHKRYSQFVKSIAMPFLQYQYDLLMEQWRELDWSKKKSRQQVLHDAERFRKAMEVFTGDEQNVKQIPKNQFNMLKMQWRELNWNKKKSRQQVLRDIKLFRTAMEVFTGDDKLHDEVTGELNELEQKSLDEMKAYFTSND